MTDQPERNLVRNHRTIGYAVAQVTVDGKELVILQTAAHRQEVAPQRLLIPVTPQDLSIHVLGELIPALQNARFLGLTPDAIRTLFERALAVTE